MKRQHSNTGTKKMRKIEKKMVAAVESNREFSETNTSVIVTRTGVFVKLYNTLIFARVKGRTYYSDGGWNTPTTASRLRALGAEYSTSAKLNKCKLRTQDEMSSLYWLGSLSAKA